MIVRQPQSGGVDIFNNASLHCTAVGKPAPTITWTKLDGTTIDGSDGHFTLLDDGTLFIQGPAQSPVLHSRHSLVSFRAGFKGGSRGPGPQASHQQRASHQTLHIFFVRDICVS